MAGPGGTITLTDGADFFPGDTDSNSGNERIYGLAGNDSIYGGDGRDYIYGGKGADELIDHSGSGEHIFGGVGNDTITVESFSDPRVEVYGGTGYDVLYADADLWKMKVVGMESLGTDTINVHGTAAQFEAFDAISFRPGQGRGNVTLTLVTSATGNVMDLSKQLGHGANIIYGSEDNDAITLGVGNDLLFGGGSDDLLHGGGGADSIFAGAGNDTLFGDSGVDTLYGGAGHDHFAFATLGPLTTATNRDHIADFTIGDDKIDLSAIDITPGGALDHFFFNGHAGFHHKVGELIYQTNGSTTTVLGDTDGDGKANFGLTLDTVVTLHASDFILS